MTDKGPALPTVDIFDIIDAIEKVNDWLGWAADATGDLDPQKPLPRYPEQSAFASQLVEFIDKQTARVSSVALPEFAEPIPSTAPPAGGSFDATRDDLADRGIALQLAASELLDLAGILTDLKLAIARVETGKGMMLRLSAMFWKIAAIPSIWELAELFAFKAVDLDVNGEAFEAANRLGEVLKAKFTELRGQLETRRTALQGTATFLLAALDVEIQVMRGEADRLRALTEALEAHVRSNGELKAEADRRATYRDAAQQDISDAEDRLADLDGEIRATDRLIGESDRRAAEMRDKLSNWRTKYQCPQGANYDTCVQHPGWRQQLYADVQAWTTALNTADTERAQARARRERQVRNRRQLEQVDLPQLRERWRSYAQDARLAEDAYLTDKAALDSERESTLQELWTSRADSHTRASEGQKQRTADLQGKLSAPLPEA